MKRDMDIIRKIVLAVRDASGVVSRVEGISPELFAVHAQLLEEAGLVNATLRVERGQIAISGQIFRLTWAGHDFADSIIDDTLWKKAKENVLGPSASWTFGILLEYIGVQIRAKIPGLDQLL